jgi:hypothetical protein
MRFLLEAGQPPDTGDDGDVTPVMMAILRLNTAAMRCVCEAVRRTIVEDMSSCRCSFLRSAHDAKCLRCGRGQCREEEAQQVSQVLAVVKLLLRFGAEVDAQSQVRRPMRWNLCTSESQSAFPLAGWQDGAALFDRRRRVRSGRALLDAGASINAPDRLAMWIELQYPLPLCSLLCCPV